MFLQGDREFDIDADGEMDKKEAKAEDVLTGMAASSGKASGEAKVIHNIRELTRIKPGDILITNSTDPGWTPVFLLIRGLVLETGGVLAHGTILSREYGLPAVTSVKNATNLIKDGDIITIDGDKGFITLGART
jgi:pyruvate,water dikinase